MRSSTSLTIRTDQQTKQEIADFAASLGLSTSVFVTAVLRQTVHDGRVVLTPTLEPTPYLEKLMREADADIEAGKNLSKSFDNADDLLRYLHSRR
jgi:antitoxin component of RelBE/YafQ-DinJ toxin-antitoxin module